MGCDIHAIVERKVTHRNDAGEAYLHEWVNSGDPDIGRNYEVFAALAGVRNNDGITPVDEPRGLPSFKGWDEEHRMASWHDIWDAPCGLFADYFERWYEDAHSASWLTLAELKAYDTTQTVNDGSLIVGRSPDGAVTMTARWTSGPHEGPVGERRIFTWPGDPDDEPTAWDRLVGFMEGVRAQHDLTDEEVRLVFFFDN